MSESTITPTLPLDAEPSKGSDHFLDYNLGRLKAIADLLALCARDKDPDVPESCRMIFASMEDLLTQELGCISDQLRDLDLWMAKLEAAAKPKDGA